MLNKLSLSLQLQILRKRFVRLNPDIDIQEIDWIATADKNASFDENVEEFKRSYPQFNWGDNEGDPYFFQAVQNLKNEAKDYGLEVVKNGKIGRLENEVDRLRKRNNALVAKSVERKLVGENKKDDNLDFENSQMNEVFDKIAEDIRATHIIVNAENKHGKTTSMMTVVSELKRRDPTLIIKVFDISTAWYSRAPLKYRQYITAQKIIDFVHGKTSFSNIGDCVYEIGDLHDVQRRIFVGLIIKMDYEVRRRMSIKYGSDAVKNLPFIVYVFEESDVYFDSNSLRSKDEEAHYLREFIKVGRNFKLRGFCICSAEVGELGTKFRRRSKRLIGKILSDEDHREYNHKVKGLGDLAMQMPKFHWVYYNGLFLSEPFNIPDVVKSVPRDYVKSIKMPADIQIKVGGEDETNKNALMILLLLISLVLIMVVTWGR